MEGQKEVFSYTYSASQQAEIKSIREKYMSPEKDEDKMEQLRRLDRSAAKPGTVAAIIVGIISTLVFGVGMCCTLVWEGLMLPGIVIGIIGILGIAAAYPVYSRITKKQREKVAPEILKLSDELMK